MQKMNKLVAFMAMAMLSVSALADKPPRQGFYISPEISNVTAKGYCKDILSTDNSATCSESEIGFGLLGGYQFNDFIAAEVGFRIAKGYDANGNVLDNGTLYEGKVDMDYSSFSLGGAGRYPISERVAIIGTLGAHFWELDVNVSVDGVNVDKLLGLEGLDGTDFYFGGGLEFMITDNIGLRAEYTRYKLKLDDYAIDIDSDVDVISTRLVFHF